MSAGRSLAAVLSAVSSSSLSRPRARYDSRVARAAAEGVRPAGRDFGLGVHARRVVRADFTLRTTRQQIEVLIVSVSYKPGVGGLRESPGLKVLDL